MKSRLYTASTLSAIAFMLTIGIYTVVQVGASTMIPIHFDMYGQPNSFAPALGAVLICPFVLAVVAFVIGKKLATSTPDIKKQLLLGHVLTVIVVVGCPDVICLQAEQSEFSFPSLVLALAGIVIAITFNGIGSLPRNTVIGIRNRWSLESDENWFFVQKFSGRLGVVIGVMIAVMAFILGNTFASMVVFLALLVVLVVGTYLYSMYIAKK